MAASVDPQESEWDVIVVGGGASGEVAAQYATQDSELTAVIVESGLLGGECSYWACMPSKGLLRPVEVLDDARYTPGVTSLVEGGVLDVPAVLARRDDIVKHLDDTSQVQWALGTGLDVIRGYGRLAGERTVEVTLPSGDVRTLTARHAVVLDTGSSPALPPVPGLSDAYPWTSRDSTNVHEVPERVVIFGGGVVACEAATWLRGLGAEVTVFHRSGLLTRQEPFAGELVADRLRDAGVTLIQSVPEEVSRPDARDTGIGMIHGGPVTLRLDGGRLVEADEILVATGRTPHTGDIGLDSIGLPAGGFLRVDEQQCVNEAGGQWLYAIGDICGRALLTHMGKYQARVVGETVAARASGEDTERGPLSRMNAFEGHRALPQVVFTIPEVGSAGLTEREAVAAGLDVETVEYDMAGLAGTYILRDVYVGRAKLVIDSATDTLVGATFVGTGTAEMVHAATMAIVGRLTLAQLWHVVPSYPTVSEVWLRLLEQLDTQRRPS